MTKRVAASHIGDSGDNVPHSTPRQRSAVVVPVNSLLSSDSPRLAGENSNHICALAESEAAFPPIIVNRRTMRVIDGMHRLRAAVIRGQSEIEVRFFDCDEREAFVLAVETNIAHGLPLSLADRTAAAVRIINSHPHWSDRKIALITGLAAKTVAARRRCSTEESPRLNTRVGRDGRIRPLNTEERRRIAGELMRAHPDASLRQIADLAGISLGTAQDVRKRLRRGENPVLPKRNGTNRRRRYSKHDELVIMNDHKVMGRTQARDRALILQNLRQDPSLRLANAGRALLRLLQVLTLDPLEWKQLIDSLPEHCMPLISDAARACADTWQEIAEQLEQRA